MNTPCRFCRRLNSLLALFLLPVSVTDAHDLPVVFDMGTESSPLADSSVRVTADDAYNPDAGFGWLSSEQTAFDRDRPLAELKHGGNPMRPDLLYRRHATPLNRDGVTSERELRFRIDVPAGNYRVQVWLGDLHHALESLAVECNGRTIAAGLSAKHIIGRNVPEATGLPLPLRFDASAADGFIELRFYGDDTEHRRQLARYEKSFPDDRRPGSYLADMWRPGSPLRFDPGSAFRRSSVLGIRVAPSVNRVLEYDTSGRLRTVGDSAAHLRDFVAAVNGGDFENAERLLEDSTKYNGIRLQGYLSLLGHPDVEGSEELRILAGAQRLVDILLGGKLGGTGAVEAGESLDLFTQARSRFLNRGRGEEGHFQENRKVVSILRLVQPDDLLYLKALVYQGRALQMLDPHRWVYASGDAQRLWQTLISAFPQNRYARYYLKDDWTPDNVWMRRDYASSDPHPPDWAAAQREAWHSLLDICEYWADHKQQADGGIGGGWGDDVELVYLFGMMAFISDGASDKSIRLAERLIEGLWKYGGMDQEAGFYRGVLDAEHSAEWTGDTLPLMLLLKWDDPVWHERAMKTASLMRNLWMGYNNHGDLHFRSNFLGSIATGNQHQAGDSFINIRATLPAMAAYRYNRNPEVARLFVEWADAWVNDALRTDRGKPKGIVPAEVSFPDGTPGGTDSPSWYEAAHPRGTVNYDWDGGHYTFYLIDLMLLAHEITGDDRYLEPFVLQRRLVDQFREERTQDPAPGSSMWAARILSDGGARQRRPFDEYWPRIQRALDAADSPVPPPLIDRAEVLSRMQHVAEQTRRMWPVLTTETSASDRVGFRGIPDPFAVMTGAFGSDMKPSVTYSGVGREFAAWVAHADERHLKAVLYSFSPAEVKAAITPWRLAVGGTYAVRVGVDTDNDDTIDEVIDESVVQLSRRGQRISFSLPGRQTTVIEVRQTKPGRATQLVADPAIVAEEIEYSIWTRDISARVHNIGSQPVRDLSVTFYESSPDSGNSAEGQLQKIGETVIPHLSWPIDLCAKSQRVAVPYVPNHAPITITVVLDEVDDVDELSETNNRATRRIELTLDDVLAPRNRVGEVGGDVSREIRRGIR